MKSSFNMILAHLIALVMAGCTIDVSTYKVYDLSSSQRLELEMRATSNQDANAAIRLAEYYAYSNYDSRKMNVWLRIATTLGSAYARDWLKKEDRRTKLPSSPKPRSNSHR